MRKRNAKLTEDEIHERIRLAHGDLVKIDISTYKNAAKLARFIDVDYGEWWAQPGAIFAGRQHIKRFHDSLKMSIDVCKKHLETAHGNQIMLDESTYIDHHTKCTFVDIDYGAWNAKPVNVLNGSKHPVRGLQDRKNTWLEKYGVDNPFKSDEVQQRVLLNTRTKVTKIKHWKTSCVLTCVGSYEAAFVSWCNQNMIDFEWQINHVMPNGKKYRIDALILDGVFANTWIEIKGFFRDDAKQKWEWFHSKYSNSELWMESRLIELGILQKK